ncbi:hypothetical protein WA026_001593 [Henosepilachna vigintioctopunctata]|uniref:Uncharacterized protein n=1 Tax=Henosepilachna vigintioctopunctata TaxID=420089 RepID=A0AAW1URF4_9CUCU
MYNIPEYIGKYCTWNNRRSGGVTVFIADWINIESTDSLNMNTAEGIHVQMRISGKLMSIIGIYRSHDSEQEHYIRELDSVLKATADSDIVCYSGDININLNAFEADD